MRRSMSLAAALTAAAGALALFSPSAQAAGGAVAPSVPPTSAAGTAATGPTCWFGACFDYVYGRQHTDTAGASIRMDVADPQVNPAQTGEHSLQELSLQDTAQQSTVEVGWTVDPELNGDSAPHLFVYHWVDGQTSCYNGCGFVPVSKTITAGMPLKAGRKADFAIRDIGGDWWILYNHTKVGYFPGSLWSGTYKRAQVVTAFGEVAENETDSPSCTDMGNGRQGSDQHASSIRDFRLYDATDKPLLTVTASSPQYYGYGKAKRNSFRLGGPGTGAC
ncbi:neprosin family prolyl endopeptidase [Streptomyces montanisoli]|uniref:Neprosin family prolyl endopeptidase n=1 Tax=Streptomyces montanisoli TaxID=2798581 RepID=A0A940M7J5_9ACTN|nr:neprosin family prolyl endopeptidase [Streptomyces montanisoli]MBP0457635.1 neprosin family prolyl endopeptidase [Streptomyces montanisoli]